MGGRIGGPGDVGIGENARAASWRYESESSDTGSHRISTWDMIAGDDGIIGEDASDLGRAVAWVARDVDLAERGRRNIHGLRCRGSLDLCRSRGLDSPGSANTRVG